MSDDTQAVEVVETIETPEVEAPAAELVVEEIEAAPAPKVDEEDAPIPKGVQKRIDRAIRRQYEAEAEAKYLREQMARQEQAKPAPQPASEAEPKLEDFQDYETYLKAAAKHEARQEYQQQMQQHTQRVEQERAQAAQRQTAESWQRKVSNATAELPDFDEVVGNLNLSELPPHIGAALAESDVGPQVAYYLMKHPDEATEIGRKTPLAAIRSLMRIEDNLAAAPAAKKATDAPAPINPVGAKAKSEKSPPEMTPKEFAEWRKSFIKNRHK